MKNVNSVLSTYSSDLFGVCSALYELGGMTVMHDASGCNSTYTTHDEPRWYQMDSMVYISALSEMEAVLGDDEKFLDDIVRTARDMHPAFIAIGGTPIPMIMGTDFKGLAKVMEKRTKIPSFGFATNGMHTYEKGAGMAFEAIADRFCTVENAGEKVANGVNILGATPLDFSINGNVEKIQEILEECGFQVVSTFAMGNSLEQIKKAGSAQVNLVISQTGLLAARLLKKRFGIPYVVGIPVGKRETQRLMEELRETVRKAEVGDSDVQNSYKDQAASLSDLTKELCKGQAAGLNDVKEVLGKDQNTGADDLKQIQEDSLSNESGNNSSSTILLIGEMVWASSIRRWLRSEKRYSDVIIICPLEAYRELTENLPVLVTEDEAVIAKEAARASVVIADPIYRHILPSDGSVKFIDMPHDAFSGRMYHHLMKVFVGDGIEDCIIL